MKRINRQNKRTRAAAIAMLGISLALIVVLHALAEGFAKLGLFSLALGMIPVLVISQLKDWRYGLILGSFFGIVSLLTAVIKGYAGVAVWHNVINPLVSVMPRAIVGLVCSLLAALANYLFTKADEKHREKAAATVTQSAADIDGNSAQSTEVTATTEGAQGKPEQNETAAETTENGDIATAAEQPRPQSLRAKRIGRVTLEFVVHAVITLVGVLLNAVGFLGMLLLFARGETVPVGDEQYTFNLMYVLEFVVGTNTLIESIVFTVLSPAIILALKKARLFR